MLDDGGRQEPKTGRVYRERGVPTRPTYVSFILSSRLTSYGPIHSPEGEGQWEAPSQTFDWGTCPLTPLEPPLLASIVQSRASRMHVGYVNN